MTPNARYYVEVSYTCVFGPGQKLETLAQALDYIHERVKRDAEINLSNDPTWCKTEIDKTVSTYVFSLAPDEVVQAEGPVPSKRIVTLSLQALLGVRVTMALFEYRSVDEHELQRIKEYGGNHA